MNISVTLIKYIELIKLMVFVVLRNVGGEWDGGMAINNVYN